MPSTYTTNGGIELPANGEQSGTWGNTVNDNMNIVDRLTNGVGVISLSGTTHTLTTADGTPSDGHYSVLVLGGAPSGTNTITIAPNDGQHVYIVKNSSGQTATFSQGSGANVSVTNGTSKIIYADGAGGGAAVVDITAALDLGALIIGGATVTSSVGELNILDGVTSTASELNILDGVTSTASELNFVAGSVAGTIVNSKAVIYGAAGEVNATTLALAGTTLTPTAAEINYVSGVTSAIQTQIDTKAATATSISAGAGLTGGGDLSASRTLSHADTSNQATVNNNGNVFIQDITLDTYGHITALGSATVDYGAGNAGLSYGAVGTYVLAGIYGGSVLENTNYSGGSLRAVGFHIYPNVAEVYSGNGVGSSFSGTWRAMGHGVNGIGNAYTSTLLLRIS
jgi:hypothetical protein